MIELIHPVDTNIPLNGKAGYFSVFRRDAAIHVFFRGNGGGFSNTRYVVSSDGVEFSKPRTILRETHICHNFYAFDDPQGGVRGIGGQIAPSSNKPHSDGLYAMELSSEWVPENPTRIVSADHPGFVDATKLWGKEGELDGHLCCLFDRRRERYLLFLRSNPKPGVRHIQYAEARRFGEFEAFSPLEIAGFNFEGDNYYSPAFVLIDEEFFGFLPFNDAEHTCIRVVRSPDGVRWHVAAELFPGKPWRNDLGDPKSNDHPVNGIVDNGDHVFFYVHHNYFRHDPLSAVKITRYSISKEQLLSTR